MENYDLKRYSNFLGNIKTDGNHWEKVEKRTITLFQVLMDGDLKELNFVLKHYPEYIELVCEHFRYLYNYSSQEADIFAASKLLEISEKYHTKQFIRNLVRKLRSVDELDTKEATAFLQNIIENKNKLHNIILKYYHTQFIEYLQSSTLHKLQQIALKKKLKFIEVENEYDFNANDRDAALDIPYMD